MKVPFATLALIALVGCAQSGTAERGQMGEELPEVWGPKALKDYDPDPSVVEVHLTASKTRVDWFDEGKTAVWAYNDQLPGPLIQAFVGQTLRVVFTNDLPSPTTIHWHGLRIDNDMDGVPAVQAPVKKGETFVYEFVLPDPGSYWYHPHVRSNEQVERGLYGALVVHERPDERPDYDMDRFFVLDDVLIDGTQLASPGEIGGMDGMMGRFGNVLLANGQVDVLEDEVTRGTRERWRIVNASNARVMWINVVGADWRIIGMDGPLIPKTFKGGERIQLPIGRRFDIEVVPKSDKDQVKLRLELPSADGGWDNYTMFDGTLVGDGASPGFSDHFAPELPALEEPTQDVVIELSTGTGGTTMEWAINGAVYGKGDAIPVVGNTPTRITITDLSGMAHPFHLHGQFFQILERGEGEVYGAQLDTALINAFETVVVQSNFSNPGKWLAHCHILEHAELGMMTEIHVDQ